MASGAPNARSVQAATAAPPSAIPTSTPTAKPPELSGAGGDHASPGPAEAIARPGFGPMPSSAPHAVWKTIVASPAASSAGKAKVFVASAAPHVATTCGLPNAPPIDASPRREDRGTVQRPVRRRLLERQQRGALGVRDQPRRPREAPAVGDDPRTGREAAGDAGDEHAARVTDRAHVAAAVAPGDRGARAISGDVEVERVDRSAADLAGAGEAAVAERGGLQLGLPAARPRAPGDRAAAVRTERRPGSRRAGAGSRDARRVTERAARLRPRGPDDVAAAAPARAVDPRHEHAALAADRDRGVTAAAGAGHGDGTAERAARAAARHDDGGPRARAVDRAPDERGVAAAADGQRDVPRDVGAQVGDRLRRREGAARRAHAHLDGVDVRRLPARPGRRGEAHPCDDRPTLGVDTEIRCADRVRVERRRRRLGPGGAGAAHGDQRHREQACTQSTHGPPKPTRVQGLRSPRPGFAYADGRAASPSMSRAITRRWISDVPS